MRNRTHRGSDLREFLRDEGLLEEVEGRALKRAMALQLERLRGEQSKRGCCSPKRYPPG